MSEAQGELIEAIDAGDIDTVRRLHHKAMQYASLWSIFEDDYDLQKPVHHAAKAGDLDVFRYLVEKCELDADTTCALKLRPIDIAAINGALAIVQYLLDKHKIDTSKTNRKGKTPSYYAAKSGNEECARLLSQGTQGRKPKREKLEPKKTEMKKPEPKKTETRKVEPKKTEMKKTEMKREKFGVRIERKEKIPEKVLARSRPVPAATKQQQQQQRQKPVEAAVGAGADGDGEEDRLRKRTLRRAEGLCEKLVEAKSLTEGIRASLLLYKECADRCDPALLEHSKALLKCLDGIDGDVHSYKKHSRMLLGKRSRPPPTSSTSLVSSVSKPKGDGGRKHISSSSRPSPATKRTSPLTPSTTTSSAPPISASTLRFQATAVKIPKKVLAERFQ